MNIPDNNGKPIVTSDMKAECIGEFSVPVEIACVCEGEHPCECCHGEMYYEIDVDIPWTTIKDIYKKMAHVASRGGAN